MIAETGIAGSGAGALEKLEIDATNLAAETTSGDIKITDVAGGVTIATVNGTVGV